MIEYCNILDLKDLFYIDEKGLVRQEEWRDVIDYENYYRVSNLGRIKSLKRQIIKNNNMLQSFKSKILKSGRSKRKYRIVALSNTKKVKSHAVHKLVAMAFLGHVPCGYKLVIDHKNDNPSDNRLENLQIVTQRVNVSKGKKSASSKTCVNKVGKRFHVNLVFNGSTVSLGAFDTLEKATQIYEEAVSLIDKGKDFLHLKNKKISSTGLKGVYLDKGRYRAIVYKDGKNINIGTYVNILDAKKAYDEYATNKKP